MSRTDSDWDDLARKLDADADPFDLPENRFHKREGKRAFRRKKIELARRNRKAKRMINPGNAAAVVEHFPDAGDSLHAILRGDFVLCDLIGELARRDPVKSTVYAATLSLSEDNARALAGWLDDGTIPGLVLLCSEYFAAVNKTTSFPKIEKTITDAGGMVRMARTHCKVIAMEAGENSWVIEGSANLRSSGCLEQISVFNDADHFAFHRQWFRDAT